MICTTCGADQLELDARDIPQTYKGRVNIIKNVAGLFLRQLRGTGPWRAGG
jgi:hypothetical protein